MTETVSAPQAWPDPGWGQSLYRGAAGIALLHIEYARAGAGSWHAAHAWVKAMTSQPISADPQTCGLHYGAPAVAFVLDAAGHPGYTDVLDQLDRHVAGITRYRLCLANQRIDVGRRPKLGEYDLIRGLTGLGLHLLRRHADGGLLREVLAYLIRLTEPVNSHGVTLPGWWSDNGPGGQPAALWPGGHANFGLAHGICGPLALLSAAMRRGVTVPRQAEAIGLICAWLDDWRVGDGTTAWWPGLLSAEEYRSGSISQAGPHRPSWCYGTPGLARAQQLAGLALGDPVRRRVAEMALTGCVTDSSQLALLSDASLCHGWAGLVQATRRVAEDSCGAGTLALRGLTERMRSQLEVYELPSTPGLLEGSAGVRLVRHAVTTEEQPRTRWDACLLLDAWSPSHHRSRNGELHDDERC